MDMTRKGFLGIGGALVAQAAVAAYAPPKESDGKVMMGFDETELGELDPTPWVPFSDRKVRMGIAGEGVCHFGSEFGYQNHPNSEVVAVAELDPVKRNQLQSRTGAKRVYASCEEMIEKEKEIDAVYIATDAPSHLRLAIMALNHGLHVVTAVPALFGEEQLQLVPDLVEAVKRSGKVYQMNETTAYRANCFAMRRLCEAGTLGSVVYTEGEYFHYGVGRTVGSYRNWRVGLPPLWYCTHATGYFTCVTHRRFTEVSACGTPSRGEIYRKNAYGNAFGSEYAFFGCEGGGGARMLVAYDVPCVNSETGRLWGQSGSFVNDRFLPGKGVSAAGVRMLRPRLPKGMPAGGHGGSHGYLSEDFLRGILVPGHKVCVDLKTALDTTVAGIYAHMSAVKGGERLVIPSCV